MFKIFNPLWLIENLFTLNWIMPSTPAQPTNTTVQNTNIPDYAQPYVMNMLGATENQLFNKDASGNISGFQAYNPYSTDPSNYVAGFSPMQQQAQQGAANLQTPGQFGQASQMSGASGMGAFNLANQANQYGGASAGVGMGGLGLGNQAAGYGAMGSQAGQQATGYGAMGAGFGQQAGMAGQNYANQATNGSIGAYMNPYIQQSLDPQLAEIRRQYGITGTQEQSQATQQGAMGGSREALMASENQRNMGTAQNQAITQGYNNAFTQAQQAQQYGANLGLQGQQAGIAGAQAGIAGQGAAMQGAGLGIQGSQAGMQGINTALSGLNQGITGVNTGLAGMGQANAAAGTLGQLGTQQLAAQEGVLNTQNTMGAQQQAQQQSITNQAIQNYANAQQYPMMQLGMMSNMLRGLPMQGMTTQQYQAQPSMAQQYAGLAGQLSATPAAKTAKAGGIMEAERFDVGGAIKADISKMPSDKLQSMIGSTSSPIVKGDINAELALRAQGASQDFAKGGILSFAAGTPPDPRDVKYTIPDDLENIPMPAHAATKGSESRKGEVNPSSRFTGPTDVPVGTTGNVQPAYTPKPLPYVQAQIAQQAAAKAAQAAAPVAERPAPVSERQSAGVLGADVGAPPAFNWDEAQKRAALTLTPEQTDAMSGKTKIGDVGSYIDTEKELESKYMDPALMAARRADRASAMAEKANTKDELERRNKQAEADKWARFGSMPGPVIANYLKASLEENKDKMANSQWGIDSEKKTNELIAKFNDSDYLIQQGQINAGYKLHETAVTDLRKNVEDAQKAQEKSLTQQHDVYKDTVQAYKDLGEQKYRTGLLDIERQKVANMPDKNQIADTANIEKWGSNFTKDKVAGNIPQDMTWQDYLADRIGKPNKSPTAGSMVTDPKTGVKTWQLPK